MSGVTPELYVQLLESITSLLTLMTKGAFLQGSHEAALIEAQGAEWVAGGAKDHLTKIVEARNAIVNAEDAIKRVVGTIRLQGPAAGDKLKELLERNLFAHSRTLKETITQTEQMANSLRTTDPTRLQGVKFFEGGPGGNVARTVASLPSEQMKTPSIQSQLRAGVEPSIVPRAHPLAQRTLDAIRQLPATFEELRRNIDKITGAMLVALRNWMMQFIARAGAAARLGMLAAEKAFERFGGRLTTPVIFFGGSWRQPQVTPVT